MRRYTSYNPFARRCAAGSRKSVPLMLLLWLGLVWNGDIPMLLVTSYSPCTTMFRRGTRRLRAFQHGRPAPKPHHHHLHHHQRRVRVGRRVLLVLFLSEVEPEPAACSSSTTDQQQQHCTGAAAETETISNPLQSTEAVSDAIITCGSSSNNNSNNNTHASTSSYPTLSTSVVLLNVVAILWGSQHAIIKQVVHDTSNPAAFTLLRFALAAALASPYTPSLLLLPSSSSLLQNAQEIVVSTVSTSSGYTNNGSLEQSSWNGDTTDTAATTTAMDSTSITTWRWGLELGLYMFLGFAFQAIGLESTTAQRSGFLLYLNVKFVPFFAYVLWRRPIRAATWASALTALAGTALLALGGGGDDLVLEGSASTTTAYHWDFNVGDAWTIAAAAASAMFILRLEQASARVADAAALNAACLWMVTLCATVWTVMVFSHQSGALVSLADGTTAAAVSSLGTELLDIATAHPLELIYLGGVTTALCNWLQTKAQRDISAERASIIYAMDPVYGAAFAYLWLGETLNTAASWCGAGLITVAAATNAWWDVSSSSTSSPCAVSTPIELGGQPNGNRDESTRKPVDTRD